MPGTEARSVLLVEDSEEVREGLRALLEHEGYRVVTARTGREALQRLREDPCVAVIVLDARMPEMNGYEFRAAQLAIERLRHIGVVILSGDEELWTKAKELGVTHCLQKPVDPEELLVLVRRYADEPAGAY